MYPSLIAFNNFNFSRKSALLTAVRGLGLTPEEGSYLSSFIVADRGQARTLSQTYYGDKENDIAPNKQFKNYNVIILKHTIKL